MACAICETRRPRRFCPGVRGEICSLCCGTEREVSVDCPLDCEYLIEARKHEQSRGLKPDQLPHSDIHFSEELIAKNQGLLTFLSGAVVKVALGTPGAVDSDVRDALESLVRTYRTLQTGLQYESRPTNPIADAMYGHLQGALQEFRRSEVEQLGITRTRDADVLLVLAFLHHFSIDRDNGRKRGRAFVDALRGFHEGIEPPAPEPDSLVL
jgi:hypothetical protein